MDERDPIWDEKEWSEIRASLQNNGEAAYLCVARALEDGSNGYEASQRLDLNLDQVARFLEPEGQLRFNDNRASLVDGAMAWLRARALNNCIGRAGGAYRVVLYKPGGQRVDTLRFSLHFEQGSRPVPPPAPAGGQLDEAWTKIAGATAFLGSAYHRGAHNDLLKTHHEKMQEVYGELMAFRGDGLDAVCVRLERLGELAGRGNVS